MEKSKEDLLKSDFRIFLINCFREINLPYPDKIQLDVANELQKSSTNFMFQAFRGLGKSVITCCYVAWLLYKDKNISVFIASASGSLASEMSRFIRHGLIGTIPWLKHLEPRGEELDSVGEFNVHGRGPSKNPSVKCRGVGQQWTGTHFDIAIVDDIEIPQNSMTQDQRDKLWGYYHQLTHMRKKPHGRVITIGTPQCEDSIYDRIKDEIGIHSCIWTVEVPTEDKLPYYGDALGPMIKKMISEGAEPGDLTCPERFDEKVVSSIKSIRSEFMLHYMLDTALSDEDRFPLKLKNLIVHDSDPDLAPSKIVWSQEPDNKITNIPNVGLRGDGLFYGKEVKGVWSPYNHSVMAIDPAGTGKDETGWCIVKELAGQLHLIDAGGLSGGYTDTNLEFLAEKAKEYKVDQVIIESNFGDGMWTKMFTPVLHSIHPKCGIEEVKVSITKEFRICDILEPVISNHKLVVNRQLFITDKKSVDRKEAENAIRYSLFYQMTRISRDKGSLKHDDRLDALSLAVGSFTSNFAVPEKIHQKRVKGREWQLNEEQKELIKYHQKMMKLSKEGVYSDKPKVVDFRKKYKKNTRY